ncbi:DNA-binding domain-containing protein [Marivita sp.]|uniref:DNA-binding domain-containing protein n=1 Tax=Marivita sp. TaxID=2003365 RepID=UPI003F707F3B
MKTEADAHQFNDILKPFYVRRERPSFLQAYRFAVRIAKAQGIRVPSPQGAKRELLASITREDEAILRDRNDHREAGL